MQVLTRQAIDSPPDHLRQTIMLFYISDQLQKEVMSFLDVPVTTVQKRLHDARRRLRDTMPETFREEIQNNAPSRDDTFVRRLETSIQESDIDELKELIARDPDAINRGHEWVRLGYKPHPLAYATRLGRTDVMHVLPEAGADPNVDTPYRNPMGRAMGQGDVAAMDLLYEYDAKFDPDGSLELAFEAQRPETTEWLLDKG